MTKITDLLPIPEGTKRPHAYQIFGLQEGEQDRAIIERAVAATIAGLKAAKSSTDEQLWKKAAQLVQQARQTLADPKKKAQLDARFGVVAIAEEEPQAAASPAADPLAAVLPAADPLAGVLPATDPLAGVLPPSDPLESVPPPPGAAPTSPTPVSPAQPSPVAPVPQPTSAPTAPVPSMLSPQPETPAASPVVVREKKKTRRRRQTSASMVVFGLFIVGMFGLIGLLAYVLTSDGQVAITSTDGGIKISTQPNPGDAQPEVGDPAPVTQPRQRPREIDPVMGALGGDMPVPDGQPSGLVREMETPQPMDPQQPMDTQQPMDAAASQFQPEPPAMTDPDPKPDPASEKLTEEMIEAADNMLERVRNLIRQANWKEMKSLAEQATEAPMQDQQQEQAEALYEVAELASYYRGGIERAVADLETGAEIEVNEVRLVVVETGDDLLVVRLNGRNKSYTIDGLPFSLAHQLARFQIPESPTRQAAKAVYQAILPKATPEHRQESLAWLREINEEVEGADPQRMAKTLEALYAAPTN